jgi:response regulator RpfG family c-di-GMP phosphodiesterase
MSSREREQVESVEIPGEALETGGLVTDTEGELPSVLVVDDEEQILKALRRLLASIDCEVYTATSGADAIELLDQEEIAVLISDQRMPGISGLALLNHAAKHYPNTVRIMLTGNGDWETAMEAINLGQVFRFVAKPWDHDQFVRVIDDAIEQYALIRSKKRYEKFIRRQNERLRVLNDELEARVAERTAEVTERNEEIGKLYDELETSFSSTIKAMLSIMELGDNQIVGHCRNTAERVRKFGEELGEDDQWLRHLERAALLHWIGLINAPSSMFRKPVSEYDAEEMATWEFHPTLGQQAVAQVPALDKPGRLIAYYLRRFDDPTFEASKSGNEQQVVEACYLLNICSTFERVRRLEETVGGLSARAASECALARLQAGKGSEFHPELVTKFTDMIGRETGSRKYEREVSLADLDEGMVLSRPVETAQGVPVAPREVVVTSELVERLERFRDSKGLGPIFVRT